jgi:hypothetical protein
MNRRSFTAAIFCLAAGLAGAALPAAAGLHLTTLTGSVTAFDAGASILNVNTRLGRKLFRVTAQTVVLLNNHGATTQNITAGDKATVTFRFDTSEASTIFLVRETKQQGTVTTASANAVSFFVNGTSTLALTANPNSHMQLNGIPVANPAVLNGRSASVIFEPGSLLVLSLAARASSATGTIAAIDSATNTVTLAAHGGQAARTFTLDTAATIRRKGQVVPITSLLGGDRVTVAFVRSGTTLHALAVQV